MRGQGFEVWVLMTLSLLAPAHIVHQPGTLELCASYVGEVKSSGGVKDT